MKTNNLVMRLASLMAFIAFLAVGSASAQATKGNTPRIVQQNGRHALLVDGRPFLVLAGQAHNSSAWPALMPQVWSAIEVMHANTLEVPIYWEQVEAQRGTFDFSLVDLLLKQAREHRVRLVLLWFATWKNGSSHYMPEWMKVDSKTFPNITSKDGRPVDSPSPHSRDAMEADAKAFTAVMKHLKTADPQHTVLMVQVQNEPGAYGSVRDYSAKAQQLFDGQVPAELLKPAVLNALNKPIVATGTWTDVFGKDADEYFQAWHVARYIGYVAAAGKAVNTLPLYVNVALRDPLTNPSASSYESGGATDNVLPIWKTAAPAVDLLAPDIYLPESDKALKVIELYDRPDNALFVPEIGSGERFVRYFYPTLAHGGIGFSPFGIDDNGRGEKKAETETRLAAIAQEYAMATPMMRELAQWSFDGKIRAVAEHEDHANQTIDLGTWQATIIFGTPRRTSVAEKDTLRPFGKAMIVQLNENEFLLSGTLCRFNFKPLGTNSGKAWQYMKVEEGRYENGTFKPSRILNGDETDWGGPAINKVPIVLRATLRVR